MTSRFDPQHIDLKVGLEIHQQLATNKKLFCQCKRNEKSGLESEITRQLRPSQSELGRTDDAVLFESKMARTIRYKVDPSSVCLVETDEEPPHQLNQEALEIGLSIALLLGSQPVDELHVMRKIVIDGSNTTGFQRTAVIALGGELKVGSRVVPVQAISLEEDAARIVGKTATESVYSLNRMCTPLVEVALAPVTGRYSEIVTIAVSLGQLMRSTRRVARGLGTIRQDVNVSIRNGNVVEVKGVQKLDLLPKIVEFETIRQTGMLMLAEELKNRNLKPDNFVVETVDLTGLFGTTISPVLRGVLDLGGTIAGANLAGFHGILGFEPFKGIRLGSELADIARSYGYGGIFHSDELPAYGISETEVRDVKAKLSAADDDAFFLLAGVDQDLEAVTRYFQSRIKKAFLGSPAETRSPTEDGRTRFSRPRPGAARMYPETDISPIPISEEILARINESLPPSYSSQIETYVSKHQLSPKLAKQVFDSDRQGLFEDIVRTTHVQGSIVATTITETLVSLDRDAHDTSKILDSHLRRIFELLSEGIIAKEAIPEILTVIAEGKVDNADSAIQELSLSTLSITDLEQIIRTIVTDYRWQPGQKANDSFGPLMGEVMSKVRGRADGQKVSSLLRKAIDEVSTSASS